YQLMLGILPFRTILLLCLSSLLPVFFMGIRWGRLAPSAHPAAIVAMRGLFHVVHAFFLGICVWTTLGSPLSARHLQPLFACLPLYFLTSLCVGYFCGYF